MTATPLRLTLLAAAFVLTVAGVASAQGVAVEQATDEQRATAQQHFADARTAFDERRFVEALKGFRASFDVVASPNTHLMITLALRELGRNAEAYDELGAVLERAETAAATDPKYGEAAQLAREEREALRPSIALLTVAIRGASAGARLTVAGRPIPADRWSSPIAVNPGTVTVLLTGEKGSVAREVDAPAGGEVSVSLAFDSDDRPPPPPDDRGGWQWGGSQRIIAYAVAGVGVAALAASAVTGGLALSKHGELEDACGDSPCPDRQDDIDSGRTFQLVSNVTLVAGLVAVAGGVVLFLTAPDEAPAESAALRLGPGTLTFEGRF